MIFNLLFLAPIEPRVAACYLGALFCVVNDFPSTRTLEALVRFVWNISFRAEVVGDCRSTGSSDDKFILLSTNFWLFFGGSQFAVFGGTRSSCDSCGKNLSQGIRENCASRRNWRFLKHKTSPQTVKAIKLKFAEASHKTLNCADRQWVIKTPLITCFVLLCYQLLCEQNAAQLGSVRLTVIILIAAASANDSRVEFMHSIRCKCWRIYDLPVQHECDRQLDQRGIPKSDFRRVECNYARHGEKRARETKKGRQDRSADLGLHFTRSR